jgi:hypothetical protein
MSKDDEATKELLTLLEEALPDSLFQPRSPPANERAMARARFDEKRSRAAYHIRQCYDGHSHSRPLFRLAPHRRHAVAPDGLRTCRRPVVRGVVAACLRPSDRYQGIPAPKGADWLVYHGRRCGNPRPAAPDRGSGASRGRSLCRNPIRVLNNGNYQ